MASLILGGVVYATKKSVTEFCQHMLHGRSALQSQFLFDLLSLHEEADQKIGCGVASFEVRDTEYGNRCFWLRRIDGTETDWSYKHCLSPPPHRTHVLRGMRTAVADQIKLFKADRFAHGLVRCVVTGNVVTIDASHVDHHPTSFDALATRWLAESGKSWEDVSVNETRDGSVVTELGHEHDRRSWQDSHRANAVLRIVTAGVNLGKCRSSGS